MSKKNEGSLRQQLRAMQRHNRRHSGYTTHKGVTVRPRSERIKRNHMQTVNAENRMLNDMHVRNHGGFVPISRYMP